MSSGDAVARTTALLTELVRKIALPPPHLSVEGAGRVTQLHRMICRNLEPQLRKAVGAVAEMERLEADRAVLLAKGDTRRVQEVAHVIQRLMDSVENEFYTAGRASERSTALHHGNGFCSAVSAASPRKRCLPTSSRTKTPDGSTPSRVVITRTGLATTPPASSTRTGRDGDPPSTPGPGTSSSRRSRSGRAPRSAARGRTPSPQRESPLRAYGGSVGGGVGSGVVLSRGGSSISPQRPRTPLAVYGQGGGGGVSSPALSDSTASPRRDREFIHALLRSLQLQDYAHLFTDMSLLAFYRLSTEQLALMGLPVQAQRTLYNSIDQIKQIADSHHASRSPVYDTSLS